MESGTRARCALGRKNPGRWPGACGRLLARGVKLGIDKALPIVTTAVLLDARAYVGGGNRLAGGQLITAAHIQGMIQAQGLGWRGILPGDVLYIYTGWRLTPPGTDLVHDGFRPGG